MAWNMADRPADHCVATTSKYDNIFTPAETPTFTLAPASGGTYSATTYTVRNYYGVIVASGAVSGSTLTLPGPLPLGWYRLYLVRPSSVGNPWLTAGGESMFVVCRTGGSLPARPDLSTAGCGVNGDPQFSIPDLPVRGFTGIGALRHTVYADGTSYAANKTAMEANAPYMASKWNTDTTRPLRQIVCFPNGTGGASPTTTQTDNITAITTSAVTNGAPWIEGRNEPNYNTTYDLYYPELVAFANTVHAASASARVLGPCPIFIHDGQGSNDGAQYVENLLTLGAGNYIDVISFHNYNSGDLPSMRKSMDNFVDTLTRYGQQNKPRYNTEFSSRFAQVYGSFEPRLQTQKAMFDLHMHEQYGVPKEQTSYFYDTSHGFWDFPSWMVLGDGDHQPHPMVATVRVWSEELFGKAFAARLDFGTVENDHWLGSRFAHPSNGTSVVVLQSDGRAGTVTLGVTGATSLDWVDPWGNVASKTVTGGLATFDVDTLPIYVRLPAGVTAVPEIVNYGVEVVRAQVYSTAAANTNTSTAYRGIDGVIGMANTLDETTSIYQGTEGTAPPSWFEVDLPASTRFDTVVILCPEPWQHDSSFLAFDVQYWTGSAWATSTSVTEPTATFQWTSHKCGGACFTESYYSRKNVWVVRLPAVVTSIKIRINATDYTYGGGVTVDTTNGAGIPGAETGQTSPRHISIREVQAFLSEGADGLPHPGQPMLIRPH